MTIDEVKNFLSYGHDVYAFSIKMERFERVWLKVVDDKLFTTNFGFLEKEIDPEDFSIFVERDDNYLRQTNKIPPDYFKVQKMYDSKEYEILSETCNYCRDNEIRRYPELPSVREEDIFPTIVEFVKTFLPEAYNFKLLKLKIGELKITFKTPGLRKHITLFF